MNSFMGDVSEDLIPDARGHGLCRCLAGVNANPVLGLVLGFLVFLSPGAARVDSGAIAVPEYPLGAIADEDVVVPSGMNPIDRSLGLGLGEEVLPEQLWVYRRNLGVTARVVEELQSEFVQTQDKFRKVLIDAFGQLPVNRRDVNSVRFRSLQATFQNGNDGFPVSYQLAVAWAYELDDSHFFLPVSLSVFECFVGRAVLPTDELLPDYIDKVLVLPMRVEIEAGPIERQLEEGVLIGGTSVDVISVIRDRVYRALAGESLLLADYVSRRVRPNAMIDEALTARLREERAAVDSLAVRLTEGALIVPRGDTITEAHLELLAALKSALQPVAEDSRGDRELGRTFFEQYGVWALGGSLAVLIALGWYLITHGQRRSRLPVLVRDPLRAGPGDPEGKAEDSVIVQALRDKTVQALYSQHLEFQRHEQSAAELLRELEAVIANLEPQAQDRIHQYETRIRELEQQLANKEEENRELIRVQIVSTRRDIARTLSGSEWEAN